MLKAMFRRFGFHKQEFQETKPKWHRYQSRRVRVEQKVSTYSRAKYTETWVIITALCGYEHKYLSGIYGDNGPLEWRDEIKTKRLRCTKCDKAWEQSQADPEMVS